MKSFAFTRLPISILGHFETSDVLPFSDISFFFHWLKLFKPFLTSFTAFVVLSIFFVVVLKWSLRGKRRRKVVVRSLQNVNKNGE
jgi:hypothetical protein